VQSTDNRGFGALRGVVNQDCWQRNSVLNLEDFDFLHNEIISFRENDFAADVIHVCSVEPVCAKGREIVCAFCAGIRNIERPVSKCWSASQAGIYRRCLVFDY
jgi:hypothetical protein